MSYNIQAAEFEISRLQRCCESYRAEIKRLRAVCGEAYQLAGALGASVEALDNLSAAANGEPLPHETFLPVAEPVDFRPLVNELVQRFDEYELCLPQDARRVYAELADQARKALLPPENDDEA